MRLKEFSAQNYRSITTAYNLPLSEYTVLVGPNNEGKSNILRALGLGLKLLSRGRAVATTRRSRRDIVKSCG
ncbi:MAG: AAA family ATPase [candidate division Zixibacteria bacterium]|nr:AAA family ATPase [candidate division Zixibacteria bacterium]